MAVNTDKRTWIERTLAGLGIESLGTQMRRIVFKDEGREKADTELWQETVAGLVERKPAEKKTNSFSIKHYGSS